MPKRVRDYKAEYARRIQKGLEKGLTRTQSSGHAKKGEPSISQLKQSATSTRKGMVIPKPQEVRDIKPTSSRLRNYQARVKSFASKYSLREKDVRQNSQFKALNQQTTKLQKTLEGSEDKLRSLLRDKGLSKYSRFDKLNQNAYVAIASDVSGSNLSPKDKETIFNLMNDIREKRRELGDRYRDLGMKDANDFTAYGDTPTV